MDKFSRAINAAKDNQWKLRAAISKLRAESSPNSYAALLERIHQYFPFRQPLILTRRRKNDWNDLQLNVLSPIGLHEEIIWQVLQLARYKDKINSHLKSMAVLTETLNQLDIDTSREILEKHFNEHGASIWNLETRIALRCRAAENIGESEVSSGKVPELKSGTLSHLLAYYFSDYYDQETTLNGFQNSLIKAFKGREENLLLEKYLTFKFLRKSFTALDLSDYLRIESSFSYVDAYEALMQILPYCLLVPSGKNQLIQSLPILNLLQGIRDIRLHRLLLGFHNELDEGMSAIAFETEDISELLINERHFPNLNLVGNLIKERLEGGVNGSSPMVVEQILCESLAQLEKGDIGILDLFRSTLTTISKNRFLPWAMAADAVVHGIFLPIANDMTYLEFCALCVPPTHTATAGTVPMFPNLHSSLVNTGVLIHPWGQIYLSLAAKGAAYQIALAELVRGEAANAAKTITPVIETPFPLVYGAETLRISSLIQLRDTKSALATCVSMALSRQRLAAFLPFGDLVGGDIPNDELSGFDPVDLIVGLHFAHSESRHPKTKFNLEFWCKTLLKQHGCSTLVSLHDHYPPGDQRITFILSQVFVPTNLRLVGFLKTIDDLDNARLDVCRLLLDLQREDVEVVLEEIRNIIGRRELRQAELDVESTRIFINRDGIKKWAQEAYREQFVRIRKGRVARIAPTADEIQASINEVLTKPHEFRKAESLEKNLQDPLFEIGSEIFRNCFVKEDDGLDHFLSLRIRHGSLMGYLRAPLERHHLVEQGTITLDSKICNYWTRQLISLDKRSVPTLIDALSEFQSEFDEMVEGFRSEYLQVRTQAKPNGLFVPGFAKVVWDAYHSEWEDTNDFDKLFESVWGAFRTALEIDLSNVRDHIDKIIVTRTQSLFEALCTRLDSCQLTAYNNATLITAVNDATRGAQEAIRIVKHWFVLHDEKVESAQLDFEQFLEVAHKVFRNARPSIEVEINKRKTPQNIRFDRSLVPKFTDVFFIILDNVFRHSGHKEKVSVDLECSWEMDSDSSGVLKVRVENPLASSLRLGGEDAKLARIRELIDLGAPGGVASSEGGSGLLKLARIARASGKNFKDRPVEFGYIDSNNFFVTLRMPLPFKAI